MDDIKHLYIYVATSINLFCVGPLYYEQVCMYMHRTVAEQSKAMAHSINIPRCEQVELITVALHIGRLVSSSSYIY